MELKENNQVTTECCADIIKGLNELKEKEKVDYEIERDSSYFILRLSNGDKMTYISLDIFTIKEKIKSYLLKKYKIEM